MRKPTPKRTFAFACYPKVLTSQGLFQACTHVLKLLKNLYGVKDDGLTWHEHIKKGLSERCFTQPEVDPYLFTKGDVLMILHVDGALLIRSLQ